MTKRIRGITVFEKEGKNYREYDVFSRLLRDRILFLSGEVCDDIANIIVAQLLFLEADDPGAPIHMYINSPGGEVTSGLAIYDTIQHITSPVHTVCIGMACSMGAILLAAGAPGKRSSLPNSEIMIHQPSGGARGQATDILIHAEVMRRCRHRLETIFSHHTGLPLKKVHKLMERDLFLDAEEAKELGIIDKITKTK